MTEGRDGRRRVGQMEKGLRRFWIRSIRSGRERESERERRSDSSLRRYQTAL